MQCSECIRWKQLCVTAQTETKKFSIAHCIYQPPCMDHSGLAELHRYLPQVMQTRVISPRSACNSCTVSVQWYQKYVCSSVLAVIPLQTHQRSFFYKIQYTCYSFNKFTVFLIHKICTVWVVVYITAVIRSKGVDKNCCCR